MTNLIRIFFYAFVSLIVFFALCLVTNTLWVGILGAVLSAILFYKIQGKPSVLIKKLFIGISVFVKNRRFSLEKIIYSFLLACGIGLLAGLLSPILIKRFGCLEPFRYSIFSGVMASFVTFLLKIIQGGEIK